MSACVCHEHVQWAAGDEVVGAGESHMRSYKTRGLDLEEVRRKKEEERLQLRKSKRERAGYSYSDLSH